MSPPSILGLFSPFACFLFHVLAYRLIPGAYRMQRQKLTVLVIFFVTILLPSFAYLRGATPSGVFHTGLLSLLFGYTYFHWFNMSETARRISILVRYVESGKGPEPSNYSIESIFSQRIQRLKDVGTIYERDGKLHLKHGPLLYATKLILFWRRLFYP